MLSKEEGGSEGKGRGSRGVRGVEQDTRAQVRDPSGYKFRLAHYGQVPIDLTCVSLASEGKMNHGGAEDLNPALPCRLMLKNRQGNHKMMV